MTRDEIDYLLTIIEEHVVRARKLGGYSTEAADLMVIWESLLMIVRHMQEKTPRKRNPNDSHGKADA